MCREPPISLPGTSTWYRSRGSQPPQKGMFSGKPVAPTSTVAVPVRGQRESARSKKAVSTVFPSIRWFAIAFYEHKRTPFKGQSPRGRPSAMNSPAPQRFIFLLPLKAADSEICGRNFRN